MKLILQDHMTLKNVGDIHEIHISPCQQEF